MKINKVIIVINESKRHAANTARELRKILNGEGVEQEWLPTVDLRRGSYRKLSDLRDKAADLVIACGGDGTLLQAAHRFRGTGIPILGINIGYLGFITSIRGDRIAEEMNRVLKMDFVVSQRSALDVTVIQRGKKTPGWALNDAIIIRGDNPHLISLQAKVGKRSLTHYRCDGLIVATPTGSTAYSLAAGGPIISPECKVSVITPICPQALTNRSVVVNADEPVEMMLEKSSGPGVVQVDGMTLTKAVPESTVVVTTSKDQVPIAFLPEINYYDILAEKLKWRGDGLC